MFGEPAADFCCKSRSKSAMGREPAKRIVAFRTRDGIGPIVSSAHLAAGALPFSPSGFASFCVHAFELWMVRCMCAAGVPDVSAVDVLGAHGAPRDRPKTRRHLPGARHRVSGCRTLKNLLWRVAPPEAARRSCGRTKAGRTPFQRYHEVLARLLVKPVKSAGLPDRCCPSGALLRALLVTTTSRALGYVV